MSVQRNHFLVAVVMSLTLLVKLSSTRQETKVTDLLIDHISSTQYSGQSTTPEELSSTHQYSDQSTKDDELSSTQCSDQSTAADVLSSTYQYSGESTEAKLSSTTDTSSLATSQHENLDTIESFKNEISTNEAFLPSTTPSFENNNIPFIESFDFSSLELVSDSTTNLPTNALTDETTVLTTEKWDEIVKLTSKLHKSRVKVANFAHTIKEQRKIIAKLTETVENDVMKLKSTNQAEMTELKIKNQQCREDFNSLASQLKVAKKLYGLQRYSEKLKMKLSEFDVVGNGKVNSSKTKVKFSVFEIESNEFSVKILSNIQLYSLPPRIGSFLSNVSEFSASNVGLVAVDENSFEQMNQLKLLNLSHNLLIEIESKSFKSLVQLKRLDLSYNKIELIDIGAFNGMSELEEINLQQNKLVTLPSDTFDSLLNLKILILSFNMLRKLSEDTFTEINVIEEIYFDHNNLSSIHPSIISHFERSRIIDLRKNICIDQRFPEKLTMVQLVIEVAERCNQRQ